jgi:hypothetical protein
MAAGSVAVGPTTATVGSEVQLGSTIATWGCYQVFLDLINLVAGEIVELRVYDKVPSASGTERLEQGPFSYGPLLQEEKIVFTVPVITTYYKVTIKQIGGTARSFPWEVRSA